MMRSPPLLVGLFGLLGLAGCGEPSLDILFITPEGYQELTENIVIQVLEPSDAAPFGCDDIAFGLIDEQTQRSNFVRQLTLSLGETDQLRKLRRLGPKIFLGHAKDAQDRTLASACAEVGDIQGHVEVILDAAPLATIESIGPQAYNRVLEQPPPDPLRVRVIGMQNEPLGLSPVRWTMLGSRGAPTQGESQTALDGTFALNIDPGNIPGPFLVEVRVPFGDPLLLRGMVSRTPLALQLDRPILDYKVGRIGPRGEMGLALLTMEVAGQAQVSVRLIYFDGAGGVETAQTQGFTGPAALGVIDVPSAERDRVLAVTRTSWLEINTRAELLRALSFEPPYNAAPANILSAGTCRTEGQSVALLHYPNQGNRVFDLAGKPQVTFLDQLAWLQMTDAGCVRGQDSTARLFAARLADVGVLLFDGQAAFSNTWLVLPRTLLFHAPDHGVDQSVSGVQLDQDGFIITRASVYRETDMLLAVAPERSVQVPRSTFDLKAADLNGDGALDLIPLLAALSEDRASIIYSLWPILDRKLGQTPIAAELPLPEIDAIYTPQTEAIDYDADGTKDLIIIERLTNQAQAALPQLASRLLFYPFGGI